MALSKTSLKNRFVSELTAAFGRPPDDPVLADNILQAIANAIVDEIDQNAEVPAGIPVTVSTGTGIGATTAAGEVD